MDLIYQAVGTNKHRIRLLKSFVGESTVKALDDSGAFTVCCDEHMSNPNASVWWTETVKSNTKELIEEGKSYLQAHPNLKIVIIEHGKTVDSVNWFVVISRDNVVRTFQAEADVCQFLQGFVAKQS